MNLVGYHLPLDAHPQWGNNVQLAQQCGWQLESTFGEQNLMNLGTLPDNQNTLAKTRSRIWKMCCSVNLCVWVIFQAA